VARSPAEERWSSAQTIVAVSTGVVATGVAAVYDGFIAIAVLIFGCYGSDVSERPPPDTLADALCGAPLVVAFAAVAPVAVLAPLIGAGKSVAARRWRPLAVGLAISAAAVSLLATLGEIVERGGWNSFLFVYLPLIALVLALWWVRSLSRERDLAAQKE
jgi:hypothetical protein